MWTILKIALLAAGVTVTAIANNSYSVACAAASQAAPVSSQAAADPSECLPNK